MAEPPRVVEVANSALAERDSVQVRIQAQVHVNWEVHLRYSTTDYRTAMVGVAPAPASPSQSFDAQEVEPAKPAIDTMDHQIRCGAVVAGVYPNAGNRPSHSEHRQGRGSPHCLNNEGSPAEQN